MWKELRLSRALQQLCKYPWLFNFVVRKAKQNKHVHQLLVDALAKVDKKKSLVGLGFYWRLLFSLKLKAWACVLTCLINGLTCILLGTQDTTNS